MFSTEATSHTSCCCEVASVVSDSVQLHRRQPTRLRRPWDSPGKNTGVGCHFLLQCMKVKSESEVAQSCPTLSGPMDCSLPGSSIHGIFQARVLEWGAIAFSGHTSYWACKVSQLMQLRDWIFFLAYFVYLAALGLICGMWVLLLTDVGSSSPTRDQTQAPCIGSAES